MSIPEKNLASVYLWVWQRETRASVRSLILRAKQEESEMLSASLNKRANVWTHNLLLQ